MQGGPNLGGNITGVAWDQAAEIMGRYPQLLKELVPGLTRMGAIVDPGLTGVNAYVEAAGDASRKLGITQRVFEVRKPDDLEPAFAQLASWGAQAVFVFGSTMIFGKREQIVALTIKSGETRLALERLGAIARVLDVGQHKGGSLCS